MTFLQRVSLGCLASISTVFPLTVGMVHSEEPVASWEFGTEEQSPLKSVGGVHRDVPGPRPPAYPDFAENNTAVDFDGSGARFTFADLGPESPFDFTNGDEITLEAWVDVRDLKEGENTYVIGKGRTGRAGFMPNNQNWALRMRRVNGMACVSFLFSTPPHGDGKDPWHRYTSMTGFIPNSEWHHVAATYRFGDPNSVATWIDGKKVPGKWDMGGATEKAPVVDDDEIWIGSSMGGAASTSFRGGLDSIAIHRQILDDTTLQKRYRRVGEAVVIGPAPETMPELGKLPADQVSVSFFEDFPAHDRWLMSNESWPEAAETWSGDAFLLNHLPLRYDAWGIRDSWKAPVVVRMASDVQLSPGNHTLLMRARGLARVWVDGQLVASTKPLSGSPDGEEPITPVSEPPAPGHRPKWHRCQEVTGDFQVKTISPVRVVVEAIAGGKRFRVDPGELTIAVSSDEGKTFQVLRPAALAGDPLPLTNVAVESELKRVKASLEQLNRQKRHVAAKGQDAYWQKRHEAGQAWLTEHPAPAVPTPKTKVEGPIDAFIVSRIEEMKASQGKGGTTDVSYFHKEVLPILKSECIRCHGEKDKGGLALNSRELAMLGGFSGEPAITPGDPHASAMIARMRSESAEERMPPTGTPLPEKKIQILEKWITDGAIWPEIQLTEAQTERSAVVGDTTFLRRAYLDTVGVPPTAEEVQQFLQDSSPDKRSQWIDRLLDDPRWADHWVSYWQDLLAENPTMINATLNATGPFRWFLYDSLRDDKSLDRMVTELIMLRGSSADGGSAGFGQAAQNDSPFAAKGHVVASAFLGLEMQCARCHDSPYHSTTQKDLYSLAAMFSRKSVTVPKSSTVPPGFFESKQRESLIQVTLKPGESVTPTWPFAKVTGAADDDALQSLMQNASDSREKLATLITAPQNERFAKVMANRIWRRLIGAGIVEPPHDWEGNLPSHPELLEWLAKELVASNYDVKHLTRVIMNSELYQQEAVGHNLDAEPGQRLFNAPERRRMTAEQIVDSFYEAAGCQMDVEQMTLDPDGRRAASSRNTFGTPYRSWMFVSLSNERDRPSLTFPHAAMVTEVLTAFGWSADRQAPKTDRETDPNIRQPAVMANSNLAITLTKAAYQSELADLAVNAKSPDQLIETIYLRFLSRYPTDDERQLFHDRLAEGFDSRLLPKDQVKTPEPLPRLPQVTWSNHLRSEANTIQQQHADRVRQGPPADPRLEPKWRTRYEDFVWSVANLREFVWMP
ncbi:DUF1553 domain-containing protein [Bremerella cremea]|uniref:DUF1553 domain-containing protein n=1 Tax=Bremerella cremea TaxID=1031537 RepID=UPI0031E8BB34